MGAQKLVADDDAAPAHGTGRWTAARVDRSCADCGAAFLYDPAFYARNALADPTRCRECRERRRSRRVRVRGRVEGAGPRFAFVEAEGRVYFTGPLDLHRGAPVTFFVDPEEEVTAPGRRPHAWDVAPEA